MAVNGIPATHRSSFFPSHCSRFAINEIAPWQTKAQQGPFTLSVKKNKNQENSHASAQKMKGNSLQRLPIKRFALLN
jgi:hypothetical protein